MGGFALLTTLYLQDVRGYSPLHAGLFFVPTALAAVAFGPLSGRLVATSGPRYPLLAGGVGLALSAAMLASLTPGTGVAWLVAAYALFGLGFGMISPPINDTALAGMPRSRSGVAAATVSTGRQVGQVLGVAVAGSVLASHLHLPIGRSFATASHASWWILVGFGLVAAVLGLITTGAWASRAARAAGGRPAQPLGG
jgi:MFS family permease